MEEEKNEKLNKEVTENVDIPEKNIEKQEERNKVEERPENVENTEKAENVANQEKNNDVENENDPENKETKKSKDHTAITVIIIILVFAIVCGVGGYFYLNRDKEDDDEKESKSSKVSEDEEQEEENEEKEEEKNEFNGVYFNEKFTAFDLTLDEIKNKMKNELEDSSEDFKKKGEHYEINLQDDIILEVTTNKEDKVTKVALGTMIYDEGFEKGELLGQKYAKMARKLGIPTDEVAECLQKLTGEYDTYFDIDYTKSFPQTAYDNSYTRNHIKYSFVVTANSEYELYTAVSIEATKDEDSKTTAINENVKTTKVESNSTESNTNNTQNQTTSKEETTLGQKNALSSAKSYLDFTSFSYKGLIEQLEYEGYTTEEATYAADNCRADWKEQAAKTAKSYMEYSSFSRQGLIEQLLFEGYTQEEAEYGVTSVGY